MTSEPERPGQEPGARRARARAIVTRRLVAPIQAFINTEAFSGVVLLVAAVVAIVWANSPWDSAYADVFGEHFTIDTPLFRIDEDVKHWINDALMTFFFFVVGLEIKREVMRGELSGFQRAALPGVAALGGMVAPALIYTAVNLGGDGGRGWGVPMATDIAFALGILALLGSRIPSSLRVFLLGLAIVDDIGAILVIAVFYTGDLQVDSLVIAAAILGAIFALNRAGVRHYAPYFVLGACAWVAVFESGIHATLTGVALGLMTPLGDPDASGEGPLEHLERRLHPFTSYLVVPLFALANAGVSLDPGNVQDALGSAVTLGVVAGLFVGKPLGILAASWIAVRAGLARLPESVTWWQLAGVGLLAGVGFTVALFINELAFEREDFIEDGKIGILAASLLSGVIGFVALRLLTSPGAAENDAA